MMVHVFYGTGLLVIGKPEYRLLEPCQIIFLFQNRNCLLIPKKSGGKYYVKNI